jgi:Protein of unknown function (DUF3347)
MKSFWFLLMAFALYSCGGQNETEKTTVAVEMQRPVIALADQTAAEKSLTPVINAYYSLKDALIEADSAAADLSATQLLALADSFKIDELRLDTSLAQTLETYRGNIAAETKGLIGETDLTQKRRAFSMISQNLLPFLKEVNYKAEPVYQQICPMAFNDDETAYWLSNSTEINNPYLGKKHPKYGAGMLHCGELGDSLIFKK